MKEYKGKTGGPKTNKSYVQQPRPQTRQTKQNSITAASSAASTTVHSYVAFASCEKIKEEIKI